jgi:hypothetical protein
MATHPPLDLRIKAIDPGYLARVKAEQLTKTELPAQFIPQHANGISAAVAGFAPAATDTTLISADKVGNSVGEMSASHLDYAERLHAAIPKELLQAVHGIDSVQNAVYALVVAGMKENDRQTGLGVLQTESHRINADTIAKLTKQVIAAGEQSRLSLINMALPSLQTLPETQQTEFLTMLESLIKADKRYTVFEFALFTILNEHLNEDASKDVKEKYFKYTDIIEEINLLISILARVSTRNDNDATLVHGRIIKLFTNEPLPLATKSDCTLTAISNALHELNLVSPLLKKTVIEACADCVIHDGRVLPVEAELLQAIAVSIDCPMPPILA